MLMTVAAADRRRFCSIRAPRRAWNRELNYALLWQRLPFARRGGPVGLLSRPVVGALSPRGPEAHGKKAAGTKKCVDTWRSNMKLARFVPVLTLSGLILMACGGTTTPTTTTATVPSDLSISSFTQDFSYMPNLKGLVTAGKGMVGVLLPDTTSSARYVAFDAPYLKQALDAAGYSSSQYKIDNAQGQEAQELALAQADITAGATVLIMDPLNSSVGSQIQAYAQSHGVKVISYDRASFTGTNTY